MSSSDVQLESVAAACPALARFTRDLVNKELWERSDLCPRDRSLVTIAALSSLGETIDLGRHFDEALDNSVSAAELSEAVTHLAFYAGWARATAAAVTLSEVFGRRGIGLAQVAQNTPELLPLDQEAEDRREAGVSGFFAPISPGIVQYTQYPLFMEIWQRPDLSPRDRSLVTVSALVATGKVGQITGHLNRALDNGVTATEAGEILTQLAFHTGWPNAIAAALVYKQVFESRAKLAEDA